MPQIYKARILLALVAALALSGCQTKMAPHGALETPTATQETFALNERQRAILEDAGLPTDEEALTQNQQSAIWAIEEMLSYLEERYDDAFFYAGYVPSGPLDKEHLIAISERYYGWGEITVYRVYVDGAYQYEDNYLSLPAKQMYAKAISAWLTERLSPDEFAVFFDDATVEGEPHEDTILSQMSASSYVFISEQAATEDGLSAIVDDFGPWIQERSGGTAASATMFCLVTEDTLKESNIVNYMQILADRQYSAYCRCSLNAGGEPRIQKYTAD